MLPARYEFKGPSINSTDTLSLKAIGDRLQRSNYLSRIYHERKVRNRRQRTDIRKYSFANRTIRLWNWLPADILGTLPCKPSAFGKRVRRVINVMNWRDSEWVVNCLNSAVNWSEVKWIVVQWRGLIRVYREGYLWLVKWNEVKCSEVKWSESPVKNGVLYLWINNNRN
jgi:hypothetical protein